MINNHVVYSSEERILFYKHTLRFVINAVCNPSRAGQVVRNHCEPSHRTPIIFDVSTC